ncbi:hypothetical protein [Streptomyces griseoluteus]|uniref:hypothetical protein n=1 Tax=Streptomyces griseoluteus TaxID=29306 RepID=UPI00382FEAEB
MNAVLWVIAALLAAAFLFSGPCELVPSHEKYIAVQPAAGMSWGGAAQGWSGRAR